MVTRISLIIIFNLLGFSARAQSLMDSSRVITPEYTQFFIQRFDHWFENKVYKVSKNFSQLDQEIWNEFKNKNKTLASKREDGSFVRAFSYSIAMDMKQINEYSLSFLNIDKNPEVDKLIRQRVSEKSRTLMAEIDPSKQLGLRFSSQVGQLSLLIYEDHVESFLPRLAKSIKMDLSNIKGAGSGIIEIKWNGSQIQSVSVTRLKIETEERCRGVADILQKDLLIDDKGNRRIICHSQRFEPEALGPLAEKVNLQFRQSWNMQIGELIEGAGGKYEMVYP